MAGVSCYCFGHILPFIGLNTPSIFQNKEDVRMLNRELCKSEGRNTEKNTALSS